MFGRLDKFNGPIFRGAYIGGGGGGLVFGMLIGLNICGCIFGGGGGYIWGVY